MVGWHHRLNGHEFEQALGDGEGQGSLVCCSAQGPKEQDTTERLNNNKNNISNNSLCYAAMSNSAAQTVLDLYQFGFPTILEGP